MSKNDTTTKLAALVKMAHRTIEWNANASSDLSCITSNADGHDGRYTVGPLGGAPVFTIEGPRAHDDAWSAAHNRTAAPALAAWVLAIAPALTEWAEARKAVAAAGEVIKATYRAAGPNRAPDVDSYSAAVSAWSDAKARLTDDEHALLAALASLDAQAVAP